ncbi:peptidase M4 [Pedobacter sp. KBW06]|uniref:PepSY-associated TM helix domain-containing protein n=1 Tax=Pedobacter sp. KBW06 TaxID=2153359 RepID=UPI000F59C636|nr:PepSY-associated TM helix domain-containing protein [Pedobacter sp. KBW06]RQO66316.1 peptidase M4 [Pedobacter sp. KBW06]
MNFKKINAFLHLWLGLLSGLVVFILGITGCILVFETEIRNALEPYRFVPVEAKQMLAPAQLKAKTAVQLNAPASITGITYHTSEEAATIYYQLKDKSEWEAYVNPYSGKLIKVRPQAIGFFDVVLYLHTSLLIPGKAGQAIVSYATLIFIVLLISGIVLWWPKKWNKSSRKKSFSIKWNAKFKRLNYDLHNVPGFYSMLFVLVIAFSGVLISIPWLAKGLYWMGSGGASLPKRVPPSSKVIQGSPPYKNGVDLLWTKFANAKPGMGKIILSISYPEKKEEVITLVYNPKPGTSYQSEIQYYDQYNLKKIDMPHFWQKEYIKAHLGDLFGRLAFDTHTGQIGSLPGKILAFIASFIAASLPVTGFYIWWGKRKKKI